MQKRDSQEVDKWVAAKATVTSVKQRLLPWTYGSSLYGPVYTLPQYTVTFSYKAGERTLAGTYITTSPPECGYGFDIFYDLNNPTTNTGLDEPITPTGRWTAWTLGIGFALAYALWDWFGN